MFLAGVRRIASIVYFFFAKLAFSQFRQRKRQIISSQHTKLQYFPCYPSTGFGIGKGVVMVL